MTSKRNITIAAVVVAVAAIVLLYFFVDPSEARWAPKCLFHELTGWDCPGCGAQRALHALLHGRWHEAFSYNPFFLICVPVAAILGIIELWRQRWPRLYRRVYRPATFILIAAAIIAWTILRNLR